MPMLTTANEISVLTDEPDGQWTAAHNAEIHGEVDRVQHTTVIKSGTSTRGHIPYDKSSWSIIYQ